MVFNTVGQTITVGQMIGRTNDGRTNDGRTNDSAPTKDFRDLLMLRSARPFLSEQEWMQIVFFCRRSRS